MEEEERCRGQDIVPAKHVRRMADKAASHKIVYSFWKWHDLRVMPFPLSSVHVAHARLGCNKNVWVRGEMILPPRGCGHISEPGPNSGDSCAYFRLGLHR